MGIVHEWMNKTFVASPTFDTFIDAAERPATGLLIGTTDAINAEPPTRGNIRSDVREFFEKSDRGASDREPDR